MSLGLSDLWQVRGPEGIEKTADTKPWDALCETIWKPYRESERQARATRTDNLIKRSDVCTTTV
jgi:hypothetical protein